MAFKPRKDNAARKDYGQQGKVARLRILAGCRYTFPNGTIGKLEEHGIYVKGLGVIPYNEMTMDQLEEVTRQNEAFINHEDIEPVTEDWARAEIKRMISDKEDPFRIKTAKALFRKCFRKGFDKERVNLADVVFKDPVWEELPPSQPEPLLPPEFDGEVPF